jgi:hypothetical protein
VGRLVETPVAELKPAQLTDQTCGIASLWPQQPFAVWANFPPLSATVTIDKFGGPRCFAELLVFDTWLGNMDRHNTNLIYRESGHGPWELVLIDHGHIFANGQWANNLTDLQTPVSAANLATAPFIRKDNTVLSQVFAILARDQVALLHQTAQRFSAIGDDTVAAAIMEIPNEFANDAQLTSISQIVNLRKNRLVQIFNG